jgi:hypothetical protein
MPTYRAGTSEQEAYQDNQLATEAIRSRFADSEVAIAQVTELDRASVARHQIYDRLVDQKLDG